MFCLYSLLTFKIPLFFWYSFQIIDRIVHYLYKQVLKKPWMLFLVYPGCFLLGYSYSIQLDEVSMLVASILSMNDKTLVTTLSVSAHLRLSIFTGS